MRWRTRGGGPAGVLGGRRQVRRRGMMKPESRNDQPARVLRFRARRAAPAPRGSIAAPHDDLPVADPGKYAGGGDDDYRHRMRMNVLAAVVLALLIGGGGWLVGTLGQGR